MTSKWNIWRTLRRPRYWLVVLGLALLNRFVLVPLLLPEPQDRVAVPYTFFKQQVVAGNVIEITGRGEAIQGSFRQAIADPAPDGGPAPRALHQVRDKHSRLWRRLAAAAAGTT